MTEPIDWAALQAQWTADFEQLGPPCSHLSCWEATTRNPCGCARCPGCAGMVAFAAKHDVDALEAAFDDLPQP